VLGPPDGLSDDQLRAVAHPAGPLLVTGGGGTGKTSILVARFAHLVEQGAAPEHVLLLTESGAAAEALRGRVEDALGGRPYEELSVLSFRACSARLLHDEALAAGTDPFAVSVGPADRLAMLLERIDELSLRHHDFGGDPSALLARFVRRIDRLEDEGVGASDYAAWADALPEDDDAARVRAAREREFAAAWAAHDRLLAETGALDAGQLVLGAVRLLRDAPHVRRRVAGRHRHVLVDDVQDLGFASVLLLRLLCSEHGSLTAAGDPDASVRRFRGAAEKNLDDLRAELPHAAEVRLTRSFRVPARVLAAAEAVLAPIAGRPARAPQGREGGDIVLWRCANERAQAQAVAADVERLVSREGVDPGAVAILVRSVRREGQAISVALEERDVPHRVLGAAAFFARAEVRDVLAWLRLLADPHDAGAVVRALARPPVELRSADLARCTQIARRRKLDMVGALVAATESPQIPPEARDRILAFLKLYRSAAASFDTIRPDLYVHRLIERLGLRRQLLFAAQADVVERLRSFSRLTELATAYARRQPQATPREFARYVAAVAEAGLPDDPDAGPEAGPGPGVTVLAMDAARDREWRHVYILGLHAGRMPGARREDLEPIPDTLLPEALPPDDRDAHVAGMRRLFAFAVQRSSERVVLAHPQASDRGAAQPPSPLAEEVRAALGLAWQDRAEELFGPAEALPAAYRALRDELLEGIGRTGSRLGEMRFDTDLDISHAVVRYLEVVKLAALLDRTRTQSIAEALPEINARLLGAVTSEQREIFLTSSLDELLLGAEADAARRAAAATARAEPSLEPFIPRRGDGLVLSASDIEAYRACPLKYKFARVFRIPSDPTIHQRFGIAVHQVLERWHADGIGKSLHELHGLFDAAWRRGGFGDSEEERQLRAKAVTALERYHARWSEEDAEPLWFERSFAFRLGPHLLRGRVDRVDRLADGGYELIDYKTGRPKTASQLRDDVQLSLYAVGAREAWQLEAAHGSYYYVLDDEKVRVPRDVEDPEWIRDTVTEVAEGIGAQGFEPTPSYAVCSRCDYRIACPAAER
jgi:DNA helicase II / ATP-dependent DNA helicase PcrA